MAPPIVIPAPSAAAESAAPLAIRIFLSATLRVVTSSSVVEPWTVKLPRIVTLLESNAIAVSTDEVNDSKFVISTLLDAVYEFNDVL